MPTKWTDSFAEFVIAKIILALHRILKRTQLKSQNFVMTSVSSCQHKFSNIGSSMHCCQMSKADAPHVDFLIRTKLIGL
jgi:hypothetical protein